jgi:hypothetical protein
VFAGIGDLDTLRALSTSVGMWDRPQMSVTESWGRSASWSDSIIASTSRARGGSISLTTQREAVLSEGDIANLPFGTALVLQTRQWTLMSTEAWFESPCWTNVVARAPAEIIRHPVMTP